MAATRYCLRVSVDALRRRDVLLRISPVISRATDVAKAASNIVILSSVIPAPVLGSISDTGGGVGVATTGSTSTTGADVGGEVGTGGAGVLTTTTAVDVGALVGTSVGVLTGVSIGVLVGVLIGVLVGVTVSPGGGGGGG
jgi:hypothetical protein